MSFLATAVLTFIAIVVGYLSDSLPDSSLTQFDRACIIKVSSIRWRPWVKDGPISVLLRRSMTTAMGVLGWDSAVTDHDEGREQRSKGLEKFILALSDQQLVTGLAVLIAGFVSPCSLSMYHFNIVAALGWFSSTTHLSTLAVLRIYFIEHPRLRNWRVAAMLAVLALLIIAQFITGASTLDNSLPVHCAFSDGASSPSSFLNPLTLTVIIIFLIATYCERIVRLYILDPEWSIQAWFVDAVVMALMKGPRLSKRQYHNGQQLVKIIIESSHKTKAEQGVLWRRLNERRRYRRHYYNLMSKRSRTTRRLALLLMMMTEINHSFLGDLLTLEFGVAFGITQVVIARIAKPSAGVVGSQDDINFGQLVPLLLILLPFLAAGEVYFGNNDYLYAQEMVLTALILERHDDMLKKPSNDEIASTNHTHQGNPFFPREIGFADFFELASSTQPASENILGTADASMVPQSLGGVSPSLRRSTSIELQELPAQQLRRPDTETGQRAPMRGDNGLASIVSRSPVPKNRAQQEKDSKLQSLWSHFAILVFYIILVETLLAVILGGVADTLYIFAIIVLATYANTVVLNICYNIILGLREARNEQHRGGA